MVIHPHVPPASSTTSETLVPKRPSVQILGGGLAGLATAYYARRHGIEAEVFEAAPHVGGNARTLRFGDQLVDTGAHRLHDKHPAATAAFRELLGPAMQRVEVPSQIVWRGRGIEFPLRPLDAARQMGRLPLLRVLAENVFRRRDRTPPETLEALALQRYGPTLARAFLLNYSEKLWGLPADRLDVRVAGGRLRGLTLGTLARELVFGARKATAHLDGAFYYPTQGFGMLVDALADAIGAERLHTAAPVQRVAHNGRRIQTVTVGDRSPQRAGAVVSTVPLPRFLALLDPAPPPDVLAAAEALRYRHLRLAVVRLAQSSVSPFASLYFPEPHVPFTRLYEPKNRSAALAPPDRTAAVLEVPCQSEDAWWTMPDVEFAREVVAALQATPVETGPVLGVDSVRLAHAYPVLAAGSSAHAERLLAYAARFENLTLAGRTGTFRYLHTHDLFAEAKAWAEEFEAQKHAGADLC
ncbi:MAG: FAD-dependent oxidoreductase [Bacteroidota bacterium]